VGRKSTAKWTRRVLKVHALLTSKWTSDHAEGARRRRLFGRHRAYQQASARLDWPNDRPAA